MKILFLTSRLPFPPIGGDKVRTFNFLKHLSKNHRLTLLSFVAKTRELDCLHKYSRYFDRIEAVSLPRSQSLAQALIGLATKTPLQIHYYYSRRMKQLVLHELADSYDIIFCHLIRMAQYIPESSSIHKVVDFSDALSMNYERSLGIRKRITSVVHWIEHKRVRNYERHTLNRVDKAMFISEVDREYLHDTEPGDPPVRVFANGVDLDQFKFNTEPRDHSRIVFVGNMRTLPNSDAVINFAKEVFPLIRKAWPDAQFYVVGNQPGRQVRRLNKRENVFVTGFVDSVTEYLNQSTIMVAPMRAGAGVQNKILEALAIGIPVVTTSVGAEGLDARVLTVANTAEEISAAILDLLGSLKKRENLSRAGRSYVERHFAWGRVLQDLDDFIRPAKI